MSDHDFERRFERLLRDDAEQGVRPVDPTRVAHLAVGQGSGRGSRWAWLRGSRLVLVAALVGVGLLAAFGLGSRLLVVPTSTATPGPSATAVSQSPVPTAAPSPTAGPSPTASPIPTPTSTPSPGPTPTPTLSPTPSPSPTATPTPVAVPTANPAGWVELAGFPTYGATTQVTGIAYGGNRFVAVGWSARNGNTHGRVWTSPNGLAWTAQADAAFAHLSLEAVTFNGSQFYAFASAPTTVWHSADGAAWQKVELPTFGGELGTFDAFTGGRVAEATSAGGTMFAAGEATVTGGDISCNETCVAVWRSTNGTDWSQSIVVDGDSFQTSASMLGQSVVGTAGSYIGKGVWSSTDSDTWARPDGIPDSDGFLDATSDGQRIVLVGYGPTADDDYGQAAALVGDGSTWDLVSMGEASGPAEQVASAAGKFVAVGTGPGVIATWWSTDGRAWTRGPDVGPALSLDLGPLGGDDPFNHRTIGAGSAGVVLAQTGTDRLHVWFAPMSAFGG